MANTFKKIVALLLGAMLLLGLLAGCSGEEIPEQQIGEDGQSNTIIISYSPSGYNYSWVEKLIETFNETYKDKGIQAVLQLRDGGYVEQELKLGPEKNDIDIYFANNMSLDNLLDYSKKVMRNDTDPLLAPLDDVFNSPAIGADGKEETRTIGERLMPGYEVYYRYSGKIEKWHGQIFALTAQSGIEGVIMNPSVLAKAGITKMPNTSDELIACMDTVYQKGVVEGGGYYPYTWAGANAPGYWGALYDYWFIQQIGVDAWNDFCATKPASGDVLNDGWQVYDNIAIQKALEPMRELLHLDYSADGSVNATHIEAQHVLAVGEAAMMVTGDWLQEEMELEYFDEVSQCVMIKAPILSSLGTEWGISDADLSKAIDLLDAGKTNAEICAAVSGLDEAEAQKLRDARNVVYGLGGRYQTVIPNYSNCVENAKLFLRFMYSEDGCRILLEESSAVPPLLCDSYEYSNPTPFVDSCIDIIDNPDAVFTAFNEQISPIRAGSDMLQWSSNTFSTPNTYKALLMNEDYTAEYVWQTELAYVKSHWSTWVAMAGLG